MAQIRERVKKNGKKSFFVRIRMKGKPEATASFERLTDARIWAQHTETAIREGRYATTAEAQKHTVSDLVERYISDVLPRKPKIHNEYACRLKWWANQRRYGDTLRDADWVHLLPEAPKGTRVQHRSHRRLFQDLILCLPHRGGKNWLDSINIIDREKVTDGGKNHSQQEY